MKWSFSLLFSLILTLNCTAQDAPQEAVKSIDGIVNRGLAIISGEKGKQRNWNEFRQLFTPTAQFAVLMHDSTGNTQYRSFNLEEFVRIGMRGYETNGFLEYELEKTVDEYNGIAQVFQSYYAKGLTEEKGINSYQLMYDGNRWWITSILWTSNSNGVPLPEGY